VLVVVGASIPGFATTVNILNVLWAAAPLGCMVLGLFLVLLIKEVDLSLESTFAFCPAVAIVLLQLWFGDQIPASMAALAALLTPMLGLAIGAATGAFSVYLRVNAFLVTLATLLLMRGVVIYLIPEGVYYLPGAYTFLGEQRVIGIPIAVLVWLAVYVGAYALIEHHRFGREIYAIGNNEEAAFLAGIKVRRTKIWCFAFAGFAAALGGLLEVGRLQSVVADLGQGSILMVFAGTILGGTSLNGGVGRLSGVFGAVIVIALIENIMNLIGVEPSIRQMVFGFVLLVAIYLASLQDRFALRAIRQ
jgi:ribose/xylose/arabinose/galactoside ABC-type transport system permease subunit